MIVEILIPDMAAKTSGFSSYWRDLIFAGNRPAHPSAHALLNAYVRLTESAIRSYETGRLLTQRGWRTHDRIEISAFNQAALEFEVCITNLYRGATFMVRIRGSKVLNQTFKDSLGKKPVIVSRIDDIRKLRRAVHHLDSDILGGKIAAGKPSFMQSEGDITMRDGKDVKSIDRLQIGAEVPSHWLYDAVFFIVEAVFFIVEDRT
ncbi:MAG: hypothetical protein WA581_21200 [Candidatus Acidiferrales bacterium]